MEKFLTIYDTVAGFEADSGNMETKGHYVSETMNDTNAHFKEGKVELPIVPPSESKAADICLVDNGGNKYIVDGTSYSTDLFPAEQYIPIGVVVVPGAHTEDGTARIISLKAMDYNNPDSGNESGNIGICWGGYGYDVPVLENKTMFPCIAEDLRTIEGEQSIKNWYNIYDISNSLPSDYYTVYPNPYDEGAFYRGGTTSSAYKANPSPYLTGGLKNEIYHSTENTGSILADMGGRVNTAAILAVDNSAGTNWQTADTITNTGHTETIHPAAQCTWRYHTTGTTQGDWYLPAAGEMGYLAARWKAVEASFAKVRDAGFVAVSLPVNCEYWSSTEYSVLYAVDLYCGSNGASLGNYGYKYSGNYARAFLAV